MFNDFRERGKERRNIAPTRNQTYCLGMCHDQKSNSQAFGVWDDALSKGATRPGPLFLIVMPSRIRNGESSLLLHPSHLAIKCYLVNIQ